MFHSRNPLYKNPVGAVPDGQPVHFRITTPRDLRVSGARLLLLHDSDQSVQTLDLFWCGMNGDNFEWWECHFVPKKAGLCFYHFQVHTWRGWQDLYRGEDGEDSGFQGTPGALWQLTVYDRNFRTPDWLTGGVMYQVFPDRFFASGREKAGVPTDRVLHEGWSETPLWKPDEKGDVKNNDYFGGDLPGITEKLDYLVSLGVTCLYLNPIFEAHSNHRYNTADYEKIDPLLGDEADFRALCAEAKKRGIRVLLDGVFNHTGSDSVYFNREGRYPNPGAYQSKSSPYYPWFQFDQWPDRYQSWWNFNTLPDLKEEEPAYNAFINGKGGVIQKWLAAGASGWRLDVVDELPDPFLDRLCMAAREQDQNAVVLGEVWEDATTKSAYGSRRRYFLGGQLDSVMNYPFRDAVLGFLTGQDAAQMMEGINEILEHYPPQVTRMLMNHIGTHDTERALTMLGGEPLNGRDRFWQSGQSLTPQQRERGLKRLRMAALLQYTLPGVPCLYYGDEAGMEGYRDPFNRKGYPWGTEDRDLVSWYQRLGALRAVFDCLREGAFTPIQASDHVLLYLRESARDALLVAVNAADVPQQLYLPGDWRTADVEFGPEPDRNGGVRLPAVGGLLLSRRKAVPGTAPLFPHKDVSSEETMESIKDRILESPEKPFLREKLMDFLNRLDS